MVNKGKGEEGEEVRGNVDATKVGLVGRKVVGGVTPLETLELFLALVKDEEDNVEVVRLSSLVEGTAS